MVMPAGGELDCSRATCARPVVVAITRSIRLALTASYLWAYQPRGHAASMPQAFAARPFTRSVRFTANPPQEVMFS